MTSVPIYRGRGCASCGGTGYRQRKGIFEIFPIDDDIRAMIYQKVTAEEIRQAALDRGMRTLREDGLRKVVAGITTLEEVLSATMERKD